MFKHFFVLLASFLFISPGLSMAGEETTVSATEEVASLEEPMTASEVAEQYRQKLKETVSAPIAPEENYTFEFDSFGRYMPTVDAKNQSGKVGVVDSASEFNYLFKLFGKIPTQAGVIAEYISINNSTDLLLPSKLTGVSIGMESTVPFFNLNKTFLRFGIAPSFYGDSWNIRTSNFRIPMRFFLIHTPNEKLVLIGGVAVRPNFREVVLPILGFIYMPNERWVFNIVPDRPNITYNINKKWSVFLEGDQTGGEYKVNLEDRKDQVMEYNENHAGLGTSYEFNKYLQVSLSGGYMFNRTIRYRHKDLGKVALENGAYTELRVEVTI